MASIVKRKNKYVLIYRAEDENGVSRQRWETFDTQAAAKKRKQEVDTQIKNETLVVPATKTVKDLFTEYVSIYGVNNWSLSTYNGNLGIINNYILPLIGDEKLADITPRMMDRYYMSLLKVKAKPGIYHQHKEEFLTPGHVKYIHKILRSAFNQAVKWELMPRNPVEHATLPKAESKVREIWDADTLFKAIDLCDDEILKLALNVAFAGSLRMGEMLGLTWDCVEISPHSIETGGAYIYINKEIQRVSRKAFKELSGKGVVRVFPAKLSSPSTCLVLKEPKTKTSTRKVFLPKSVAEMLVERKKKVEEYKCLLGDEYKDYGLVFCSETGTPIEGSLINRALDKLIKENGLPKVVFHSIRHTSTTYKLKLTGGDIKAVQGDTGHGTAQMVTERYAHILDDDRRLNAAKLQTAFYDSEAKGNSDEAPALPKDVAEDDQALVMKLLSNPEALALLKSLAKAL